MCNDSKARLLAYGAAFGVAFTDTMFLVLFTDQFINAGVTFAIGVGCLLWAYHVPGKFDK